MLLGWGCCSTGVYHWHIFFYETIYVCVQTSSLLASLQAALSASSSAAAREGALVTVAELCKTLGHTVEPFVVTVLLSAILERYGDKVGLALLVMPALICILLVPLHTTACTPMRGPALLIC